MPRAEAQEAAQSGCGVIDNKLPPVRLGFSLSQDQFKARNQAGFTIHNNTTCTLFVPSNGDSEPGRLRIMYDVQDQRRSSTPSHKEYWVESDVAFYKELPPGKSLEFGVNKIHAVKRLTISVRFLFSWETSGPPTADFEHRVYFDSANWPRGS